jgi:DNA gyrase subunit A
MATRRRGQDADNTQPVLERIIDIDVSEEMRTSFLEYAYSVIHTRALPDARDGLKPVQRRILYRMREMGLTPDRAHVKCARVIGDVMATLHPHGDGAIYDALARMAQPFSLRLPLVDGHGSFGSPDDGPAAYRYTECRLSAAAMTMTESLDEDTVDFVPNYDGQETQPSVLPSGIPNLLVNGTSGIAVGMATNIAPHNLVEVVAAARHRLAHPDCDLDSLMRHLPGPDLPTGGRIVGLDGIREAYATGRGTFRIRATTAVVNVTARRRAIAVTELPYGVGPDRLKAKIAELVRAGKLTGISAVEDYSEGTETRVEIEIRSGFEPSAILDALYRLTPLEETFGVNAVALVDGQPQTLGLIRLLDVFLDHRRSVVRRRTEYRRRRAADRLHLVEGLLIAVLDIDEVIAVIRGSEDAPSARARLMDVFDLDQTQADYILDLQLRRLTRLARVELERERDELTAAIAGLDALLADPALLRATVSDELAAVAERFGTPRRTVLLDAAVVAARPAPGTATLEVADDPCRVLLSATGLLARADGLSALGRGGGRARHDAVAGVVRATTRGQVGLVTSFGRVHRLGVVDLPALPPTATAPALVGGVAVSEMVGLEPGERPLCLVELTADDVSGGGVAGAAGAGLLAGGLLLATAGGIVKRVAPERLGARDTLDLIALRDGDSVVAAAPSAPDDLASEVVFVTTDAQLLRFEVAAVRPQGRGAGGMAGIRLSPGATVLTAAVVAPSSLAEAVVLTVGGTAPARRRGAPTAWTGPAAVTGTVKTTLLSEFAAKGRGTGGVRCHRLGSDEQLLLAAVAVPPLRAVSASGVPVVLPDGVLGRRDGGGVALRTGIAAVGGELAADPAATELDGREPGA